MSPATPSTFDRIMWHGDIVALAQQQYVGQFPAEMGASQWEGFFEVWN